MEEKGRAEREESEPGEETYHVKLARFKKLEEREARRQEDAPRVNIERSVPNLGRVQPASRQDRLVLGRYRGEGFPKVPGISDREPTMDRCRHAGAGGWNERQHEKHDSLKKALERGPIDARHRDDRLPFRMEINERPEPQGSGCRDSATTRRDERPPSRSWGDSEAPTRHRRFDSHDSRLDKEKMSRLEQTIQERAASRVEGVIGSAWRYGENREEGGVWPLRGEVQQKYGGPQGVAGPRRDNRPPVPPRKDKGVLGGDAWREGKRRGGGSDAGAVTMAGLIEEATDQVHGDVGSRTDKEDRFEVCEPCKVDNITQPATGWCETCDEMLCNDCYKSHCRQKMMKNHQLLSLQEKSSQKQAKKNKCQKHPGEDNTELGCNQCFLSKYHFCNEIKPEVKTRESSEFMAIHRLLSQLEERLEIIKGKKKIDLSVTGTQHDKAIAAIQEAGENLRPFIDTLVVKQITEAKMIKEDNIRNIDKVNGMKKEVEEELSIARDMLAKVKGDDNQLHITMEHLQGMTKVLESKLDDSEQKNTIKEYEFVLNPELARLLDTVKELGTLKDTRELNKDKAIDEDEFEVGRFEKFYVKLNQYDGKRSDAIQMSTDRDIRLLYVLLYRYTSGDTEVELSIEEGGKSLVSCTTTHAYTDEEFVAVKVLGDGGVHGITLQAGHRYDVAVIRTGGLMCYGTVALSEVTMHGVKFSFSNSNISSDTDVTGWQIPGFRFSLL